MKPIFEEERLFFKKKTGIDLPTDCWRNKTKIYLDCTQKIPIIQFRVKDKNIEIIKDNRNGYKKNNKIIELQPQKKIVELIDLYQKDIDELWEYSVEQTLVMLEKYKTYSWVISHSGGKDSVLVYEVFCEALNRFGEGIKWNINFANTSNDTADTYKFIKTLPKDKLNILNPKKGFYQWIADGNFFIPTILLRSCCTAYKEGQITKCYDKDECMIHVIGVRKDESTSRKKYEMVMDDKFQRNLYGKNVFSRKWTKFAPIINWKDEHVWLFILRENLNFNKQYRYGFNRCGCLICPYQSDYIDLLIEEYYPTIWKRWEAILKKNYVIHNIRENKKWEIEEYVNGRWKTGTGKIQELIKKKATPERVREVAELQGISESMAKKYFNRKCKCGKLMNITELAMFYKTFGRCEDDIKDDRELLCKKCFCDFVEITDREYKEKAFSYKKGGCHLF